MQKLSASLKWIDNNILKILTVVFIYLIPLYPKLPLQILPDTYIAIRLEDIFLALYAGVFALQVLRRKVELNNKFFVLFLLYWVAVFVSFLYGHFVQKTILFGYVGFLHAARRVEYMIPFFIAATVIKSKEDFIFLMRHVLITTILVCLYGLGQKFLGFPAIQTMNKEFAKGTTLFLTPEARVSSTFAGHYDLAAYAVLLLPLVIAYHINRARIWMFSSVLLFVVILVMTASRSSFGAFVVGTFGLLIFAKKWWYALIMLVLTVTLTLTTGTLTERFAQTFRVKQLFVNEATGEVILPQTITTEELPSGTTFVAVGSNKTSDKEKASSAALLKQQFVDEITREASRTGKPLTEEQIEKLTKERFADFTPVVGVAADISFATRLQVEWPRAVNAFKQNPLLGTGPSSITEASDNSFIRWLGEFGLLGSSLFMAILIAIFLKVASVLKNTEKKDQILLLGLLFGMIGLGINATYIDVFEASKVAYTFWLICGLYIGALPYIAKK